MLGVARTDAHPAGAGDACRHARWVCCSRSRFEFTSCVKQRCSQRRLAQPIASSVAAACTILCSPLIPSVWRQRCSLHKCRPLIPSEWRQHAYRHAYRYRLNLIFLKASASSAEALSKISNSPYITYADLQLNTEISHRMPAAETADSAAAPCNRNYSTKCKQQHCHSAPQWHNETIRRCTYAKAREVISTTSDGKQRMPLQSGCAQPLPSHDTV